jgi:hypothetical protein
MKLFLYIFLISLLFAIDARSTESEIIIGKFSSGDLTGWKEQAIWGANKSTYNLIQDNGKVVLHGTSSDAASGLIHKVDIDPKASPFIKWSWKIDHTVKKGNERIKDGHDFAVRLYVVFPRGLFSSHRAIEYVWGNVVPRGESLRSPYSKNAVMIMVDSGNELAGKWTFHKRNFYEDYKVAFGEEPPKVGAIAIMTDSDNTHETSSGYFGDITIVSLASKTENQKHREIRNKDAVPKEPSQKEVPAKEAPLKDQKQKDQKLKEQVPASTTTVPVQPQSGTPLVSEPVKP